MRYKVTYWDERNCIRVQRSSLCLERSTIPHGNPLRVNGAACTATLRKVCRVHTIVGLSHIAIIELWCDDCAELGEVTQKKGHMR
jgi:hypothetical protein